MTHAYYPRPHDGEPIMSWGYTRTDDNGNSLEGRLSVRAGGKVLDHVTRVNGERVNYGFTLLGNLDQGGQSSDQSLWRHRVQVIADRRGYRLWS